MAFERFSVSSTATGDRRSALVHIYDTAEEMRAAARAFDGSLTFTESLGVTHGFAGWAPADEHRRHLTLVRLCRPHLDTHIIAHEMVHAASSIYLFQQVGEGDLAEDHIHVGNEIHAHLVSDLFRETLRKLRR